MKPIANIHTSCLLLSRWVGRIVNRLLIFTQGRLQVTADPLDGLVESIQAMKATRAAKRYHVVSSNALISFPHFKHLVGDELAHRTLASESAQDGQPLVEGQIVGYARGELALCTNQSIQFPVVIA